MFLTTSFGQKSFNSSSFQKSKISLLIPFQLIVEFLKKKIRLQNSSLVIHSVITLQRFDSYPIFSFLTFRFHSIRNYRVHPNHDVHTVYITITSSTHLDLVLNCTRVGAVRDVALRASAECLPPDENVRPLIKPKRYQNITR